MNTTAEHPFPTPASTSAGTAIGTSTGASTGTSTGSANTAASDINKSGAAPEVLQRVVQGAHQTIDRLAETAAPHVQRLQESMNSAGDTLQHRSEQARDMGDEFTESLRATVRENPLAAIATALAVGLLVARITR